MSYTGMSRDDLEAMRSDIIRDIGKIKSIIETSESYGMDDPAGYLKDAKDSLENEMRMINEAIGKLLDEEEKELAYELLFSRP